MKYLKPTFLILSSFDMKIFVFICNQIYIWRKRKYRKDLISVYDQRSFFFINYFISIFILRLNYSSVWGSINFSNFFPTFFRESLNHRTELPRHVEFSKCSTFRKLPNRRRWRRTFGADLGGMWHGRWQGSAPGSFNTFRSALWVQNHTNSGGAKVL